jgi:putative transposase
MRQERLFIKGMFYHITSRTNNKVRAFEDDISKKIIIETLYDAKEKFNFLLTNFCIMPTHIHLLIKPDEKTNLSVVMHWIKTMSARRLNLQRKSKDHIWGNRYFARIVNNDQEYEEIMYYIDQNPVTAGLASSPEEWKESASCYRHLGLCTGLID